MVVLYLTRHPGVCHSRLVQSLKKRREKKIARRIKTISRRSKIARRTKTIACRIQKIGRRMRMCNNKSCRHFSILRAILKTFLKTSCGQFMSCDMPQMVCSRCIICACNSEKKGKIASKVTVSHNGCFTWSLVDPINFGLCITRVSCNKTANSMKMSFRMG
jgi:hypothetical protein